ncbi:MAG: hypothetical protein JO199_04410 [Candidatus Eremiobacteraeota bacterium]|nr:hypothetical protein [Candidatus Eremiobacteraeota bacterium]
MHSVRLIRERLNDRLARATQFPIALIVAPAGFGKSVALRDFLTTSRSDAVRFDVRREDATLLAFARRFSEAVKPIVPSAAASFAALQDRLLGAEDAPRLVCDWFAEHFRRTIGTIAIDDLHFAASDPDSMTFLAELMEQTAGRINWIVATRSDAGLPVATWLAYGRMDLPIDREDLRFTIDEALAAAEVGEPGVEPGDIEALCELMQGWPVAVAIALRTHTHASALREAATRELVYRYLAEQVFARVTPAQREFLLATSIFSSFDLRIAEALKGTTEFIADLRHGVAFITETGPGQYRYHDLFRDFLESELLRRGHGEWQRALSEGARLLEDGGEITAALALYAKAGDAPELLRLLETHGFRLFERGRADVLTTALEALPDQLRSTSPAALGLQATLEAARGHLEPACRGFVAAIELARHEELRLTLVHRYAIELVRQGRDAIELLEAHSGDAHTPPALRVPLLSTLATAYAHASRSREALTTMEIALALLDPTAGDDARARLYQQAAHVYAEEGDRERAGRYATLAVELALARNLYDVAMRAYSALYQIAYEDADDPIACLSILDKLLDCARKAASSQGRLYGLMASYDIEADRGNEAALERIERMLSEIPGVLPQRSEAIPATALRVAWHGDFRRARDLLAESGEPASDERRAEYFAEIALYASAAGLRDESDAAKAAAEAALESWNRPTRRALRAQLVIALFELTRGRMRSANHHLAQVKRHLTPPMRRLNAFAQAATAFYRTCGGQGDAAVTAAALERLRAEQFGGIARLLEAIPFPQTEAGGYATLSAAEREVLSLLVAGGSTREMAERASRSPRTIEAHVRSICKKLNCRSRRAVIALAIGEGWVQNGR